MKASKALITLCLAAAFFVSTAETVKAGPIMEISVEVIRSKRLPIQIKPDRAEAGTEAFREALEKARERADYIRRNYDDAQVHVSVVPLGRIVIEDKNGVTIRATEILRMGTEEFRDTLAAVRDFADYLSEEFGKLFVRVEVVEAEQSSP